MAETIEIREMLYSVDNVPDLKKIILNLDGMRQAWGEQVAKILADNHYSNSKLAELCGVSHVSVKKWLEGAIPQNRETYIRIALAAHYDVDELNRFLKRYGSYPELYVKNPEDCVILFVLNSNKYEHTYAECLKIYNSIEHLMEEDNADDSKPLETIAMSASLKNAKSDDDFHAFVIRHKGQFGRGYIKFYEYVKEFVRKNNEVYEECKRPDNRYFLAESLNWSSSLKHYIQKIYHNAVIPKRKDVIALGLHLNMNLDEINKLLSYAQMSELYPKNPVECAIIYALIDAELNEDIFFGTNILCSYVKKLLSDLKIVDVDLSLSDI